MFPELKNALRAVYLRAVWPTFSVECPFNDELWSLSETFVTGGSENDTDPFFTDSPLDKPKSGGLFVSLLHDFSGVFSE